MLNFGSISIAAAQTDSPGESSLDLGTVFAEKVSLDLSGGTVSDALLAVSKQADISLAMSADEMDLQKSFTLLVKDKPAGEVLEIISATTNLVFELKNGVLIVRSKSTPLVGPPGVATTEHDTEDANEDLPENFKGWRKHFEKHSKFWKKRRKRVELGRLVTVAKDEHLNSAVSIGADTVIYGHIDQDAVSVGGTVTIKSGAVVEGTAVSVGGKVIIEPGAVVGDDAVAVGGTVDIAEDAVLEGDRVSIGIPLPPMNSIVGAISGILLLNILGAISRSIFFFIFALLLFWLIPKRVELVNDYMREKPGISMLSGFLIFIGVIPLFIILAITIVGIPLIPIAAIAIMAMLILGLTACMVWLGDKTPLFKQNRTPLKVLIIGFVVFMLINIVPVLGAVFMLLAFFISVGAAFQSRFGSRGAG